jgi:ABC-type lipoprotein release transport system permease subunit
LEPVTDKKERVLILKALGATERYVMMNLMATGLLQILALKYSMTLGKSSFCWLRTVSRNIVTEASIHKFLRREFFMQFQKWPHLSILQIIRSRMESDNDSNLPNAA